MTKLDDIVVGQALPVGIRGSAADLAAFSGATLVGRISLNGRPASQVNGADWYDEPDADGFIGHVAFSGDLITAHGRVDGTIVITKAGQPWSPKKLNFHAKVKAAT